MKQEKLIVFPFYFKIAAVFVSCFAVVMLLKVAQLILVPIVYATLIAIILNPLVNFFIRKNISRFFSIVFSVVIASIVFALFFYLIISQVKLLSETFENFKGKIDEINRNSIEWISKNLHLKKEDVYVSIGKLNGTIFSTLTSFFSTSISKVGQLVMTFLIIPVYLIMLLYYKPLFVEFIYKLSQNKELVNNVLENSKKIIQHYLVGLFLEMFLITILNSIGLLILGIEYALLLGFLSALLNVIPYLGGIIGLVVFMFIALLTKSPIYMLYVFILYTIIQFIDNNYIVPKIVASRVQINSFVSIVVVIIGGSIWGISGMFLAIPITALLKVIFDHIQPLKPWGFLLGNTFTR